VRGVIQAVDLWLAKEGKGEETARVIRALREVTPEGEACGGESADGAMEAGEVLGVGADRFGEEGTEALAALLQAACPGPPVRHTRLALRRRSRLSSRGGGGTRN